MFRGRGDNLAFALGMLDDAVPDFEGQVEAVALFFQEIYHPQTLFKMVEAAGMAGD